MRVRFRIVGTEQVLMAMALFVRQVHIVLYMSLTQEFEFPGKDVVWLEQEQRMVTVYTTFEYNYINDGQNRALTAAQLSRFFVKVTTSRKVVSKEVVPPAN
ncbi:hypothetical protein BZG36_03389 [Bifiguratus adelaidae]|uniref:Uncharacterized protein n=1 Tax=Bifiguratus adelaidae TaxID=1938954 RepID=A0A261Y0F0_9FUNG|nr:hypothetical protein BZG36_03389 [Bifiguratus adelaidae]